MKYPKKMVNKISFIDINTDLLPDYQEFEKVNDDWNIEKHLNFNYDIDSAIAFSKLYFPNFLNYKDCIILESRFDESIFNDWYEELNGDIGRIEKMCNLYEVKDIFHINDVILTDDKVKELGGILKKTWELNLKELLPDRNIKVTLFEEDESLYITLNTVDTKVLHP